MQDLYRLMDQKRFAEARAACEERLSADPGNIEALYLLGHALFNEGNLEEASAVLKRALLLAPGEPALYLRRALVLHKRGDLAEAIRHLRKAVTLDPAFAQAQVNLANMLMEEGISGEALEHFDKAVALEPDYALAHAGRGDLLWRLNKPLLAKESYALALKADPSAHGIRYKSATLLPVLPHSSEEIDYWRETLEREIAALAKAPPPLKDPVAEVGRTLFYITYHGRNDRDIQVRLANLYARACPALLFQAPHCDGYRPHGGRIRLGFASANLGVHTIGDLNRLLIAGLPRDKFEVTVFMIGRQSEKNVALISQCTDKVVQLPQDLEAMRSTIASHRLDILHYPDIGMSPETYFLAFARLAPVQATTWGHPETTGLPNMDYFITMEDAETPEGDDHYSEHLIRMPSIIKFPVPPALDKSIDRARLHLEEDRTLYSCPQSSFKIHPDFDPMIAGILRRDPNGLVLLLQGKEEFWREELTARFKRTMGDVADRIRFVAKMNHQEFAAFLALSDVLLDPPHFGGGKTTLESLWAGTPVVTLPSLYTRGRVTTAFYRQMGFTTCVADSPDDFVDKAVRLGTDKAHSAKIRKEIAEKRSVLYESDQAIAAHTAFFIQALAEVGSRP